MKHVLRILWLTVLSCPQMLPDQLTLKNGDRLTGSIVKSDRKNLTIKYFAGTVAVPWEEVETITSGAPLHVVLQHGQMLMGPSPRRTEQWRFRRQMLEESVPHGRPSRFSGLRRNRLLTWLKIERLRNPGLLDLWSGFLDTGLATTQGNAETLTLNVGLSAARATRRDKTSVYLTSLYATNNTTGTSLTTANAIRGGVRYDANVSSRTFGFGFTDLEFDEFQSLDLRFVVGGGLGRHVRKSEKTQFDVFGGGALNKEFFSTGLNRTSGELLFGEELSHKISSITALQQRFVVYPNLSDTGSYRLNWDSSAVTKLSRWLSWQLTLSDRFLSNPVAGRKKNDVLFTTGLRFTFARE